MMPKLSPYRISVKHFTYAFSTSQKLYSPRNVPRRVVLTASSSTLKHVNSFGDEETTVANNSFYRFDSRHSSNPFSKNPTAKYSSCSKIQLTTKNPENHLVTNSQVHHPNPVINAGVSSSSQDTLVDGVATPPEPNIDASDAATRWRKQVIDIYALPRHYIYLTKFDQTALAALSTIPGYAMAPGVFDPLSLACVVVGTALASAAAFAVNQILEVPYDSQMRRTKKRVLVEGYLTPLHASIFAAACASVGVSTLYFGTTPLAAGLCATGVILYTCVYTPMKRYTVANSWMAFFIDGIQPLMGWAACTGSLSAGSLLIAAIVFSWQFPRYNAVSWLSREDYARTGYPVTCAADPDMCRRLALRHSVALLLLCGSAPLLELTTWTFAVDSLPLSGYLIYRAWKFYKNGDDESARKLYRYSLVYLPAIMVLMMVSKKHSSKDDKSKTIS